MTAGRELDALVAEKVMGWTHIPVGSHANLRSDAWTHDDGASAVFMLPFYSQDIAAAWLVVEKLDLFEDYSLYGTDERGWYIVPLETSDAALAVKADTAPLAICLAALHALTHAPGEEG